ncbi:hypothetical protein AYI70_g6927 [Smittium culicis]|uniref:Reverse transcriptase domain-containing protein n=1 Tax=Smittium culicis TaxID=133412 RepID=A0A1R1XMT3_9FUNG|nr:hypothetical protein AYI70_g6927 [Smittium culicis]
MDITHPNTSETGGQNCGHQTKQNRCEIPNIATTLYELVHRRKIQKKETWLCYINYSKAYDWVPHMALLHILRSVGMGGNLFNMIKGMYDAPKIAVRVRNEVSNPTEYL